ncbi:putative E3 ubiquitin-protein ligase RNF216 [Blattamonas nauphoetae]|uniref:E3 ubiquitin-protein ligase RNF216 n=1 Tax=Blattamonas nauphoetae TaxID=2049346 RepID=A0ABQ9XY54_9EUKA|nr:putative E3 ubiquitin-protein ligase RNF216 [Blattamonas nauphoetae]
MGERQPLYLIASTERQEYTAFVKNEKNKIEQIIKRTVETFKGIDPEWVRQQFTANPLKTEIDLITQIGEMNGGYPRARIIQAEKDPMEPFNDVNTAITDLYKDNCDRLIRNYLLQVSLEDIDKYVLTPTKHHLFPSLQFIFTRTRRIPFCTMFDDTQVDNLDTPRVPPPLPTKLDPAFAKELTACQQHFKQRTTERRRLLDKKSEVYIRETTNSGEISACEICYDSFLPEDVSTCAEGHSFCSQCLKQVFVGRNSQGRPTISCAQEGCEELYEREFVRSILGDTVARLYFQKMDDKKVTQKLKKDEFLCSLCDTIGTIQPGKAIYECVNPRCSRVYCVQCREFYHPSTKCEGMILDAAQVLLRRYVEDAMTESVAPTCRDPKCRKPIMKTTGCNNLTCECGHKMCYNCGLDFGRQNQYSHFGEPPKCPLYYGSGGADTPAQQNARAKQAALRAEKEWREKNPEYKNIAFNNPANSM